MLIFRSEFSAADGRPLDLISSGWQYMPGGSLQSDGLHVTYLGRAIVQQDGSPGQSNPPVNLYGTHLGTHGDFAVTASLKDIKGGASLQFYGDTPIVEDEFRVIPKSIEFRFKGSKLTVSTWRDYTKQKLYAQKPSYTKSFSIQSLTSGTLRLEKQGKRLTVSINGKQIAAVPNDSLTTNTVWFGMTADSPGDSWTLSGLTAEALNNGSVSAINTQVSTTYVSAADGLQTLARKKRPSFLVGAAMTSGPVVSDSKYAQLAFSGNFGSMTPENAMKWQFIHPQSGVYEFKEADGLVDQATRNGLAVHGHTLVFGEANPVWVLSLPIATDADKANVKNVMIDHIIQTVGHFKGRVASWDIVNEPLAEEVTDATTYRDHIWYKAMGEDYIAQAFRTAHAADPAAKLYINEFGLEESGNRWNAFFSLISNLKSEGVPIDGVGFESHIYQEGDEIDPSVLRAHIEQLATIGVTSRISEMDVYSDNGTDAQAQQYAEVFNACFSEPSCVSWTTWGITNRYDYSLSKSGKLAQGEDFLWDSNYSPTPAVASLKNILTK